MIEIRLLCLASSYKHGGRCIAGIDLEDEDWVRPVSKTEDGTIRWHHCATTEGRWPEAGEVWRLPIERHVPKPWQPENWEIGSPAWEYEGDLDDADLAEVLDQHTSTTPRLFGTLGDRIAADVCRAEPLQESLVLVAPDRVEWQITKNMRGNRQVRVHFRHAGAWFNLGVTDRAFNERVAKLSEGTHPRSAAGIPDGDPLWLTISLSEPFDVDDRCYKVAAAVVELP